LASSSMGMTDLGTLGGNDSVAVDVNESGIVVGYSWTAVGEVHAFVTGPDGLGMTDLNSLVSLPVGVYLDNARGINDSGQIIAMGGGVPFS